MRNSWGEVYWKAASTNQTWGVNLANLVALSIRVWPLLELVPKLTSSSDHNRFYHGLPVVGPLNLWESLRHIHCTIMSPLWTQLSVDTDKEGHRYCRPSSLDQLVDLFLIFHSWTKSTCWSSFHTGTLVYWSSHRCFLWRMRPATF